MTNAYIRRKQWEASQIAAAVINQLAEAMGDQNTGQADPYYSGVITPNNGRRPGPRYVRLKDGRQAQAVSPDAFLSIAKRR